MPRWYDWIILIPLMGITLIHIMIVKRNNTIIENMPKAYKRGITLGWWSAKIKNNIREFFNEQETPSL